MAIMTATIMMIITMMIFIMMEFAITEMEIDGITMITMENTGQTIDHIGMANIMVNTMMEDIMVATY